MCLTTIPGKYGSDYINASFIDVRKLIYNNIVVSYAHHFRDTKRNETTLQHKVSKIIIMHSLLCISISKTQHH